ncbi:hypothetical protein AJ80_03475 [Polytolypa hystricis UAMH7299]|uniref:Uncharacterized protein n=1 Tax=Polytolypa hystricis (strain UAMH7299) TaxID=1447883 RepID=A0A2B7YHF6_POLH7|nr:hypothetical protein AJ80_03475 [Polytolypa hystricis UAMH7299]
MENWTHCADEECQEFIREAYTLRGVWVELEFVCGKDDDYDCRRSFTSFISNKLKKDESITHFLRRAERYYSELEGRWEIQDEDAKRVVLNEIIPSSFYSYDMLKKALSKSFENMMSDLFKETEFSRESRPHALKRRRFS